MIGIILCKCGTEIESKIDLSELEEYIKNLDGVKFVDTSEYHFNVIEDQQIGTEESPEIKLPKPKFVQVPGFEIIVFIISIFLLIVILRIRKKD